MRGRPRYPLAGVAVAVGILLACRQSAVPRRLPSIVLITIDTLRADHVSARLMPTLDALGREAVVFEQAVTVAPLTLPAHASLLTGRYPPAHRVRDNELYALAPDVPAYASALKGKGYATGAFVSAIVLNHRYGLDRGFDTYDDEIGGAERSGSDTIARAERWIEGAPRPFFLWLHLFEPHAPYRTGTYAAEVTAADTLLAGFFKHLRDSRTWDEAIVSVTADHGESLGEHGEQTHGFFLYDATLRIPWILKAPGLAARRLPQLVRIVDEMPTILELAGVANAQSTPSRADGVSVLPLTRGRSLGLEAYSETFLPRDQFNWSPLTSIRTERLKYIDAPQPELYDLSTDPGETSNVVAARIPEAGRLKRVLGTIARSPSGQSAVAGSDPALAEKLMSLGYIDRGPVAAERAGAALADPKSKIAVYSLTMTALELSETGDVPGALNALKKAEAIDPDVAQVEFLKGTLLGRIGRYGLASAALERTLALDPQHTAARFKLALAYLRIGNLDKARQTLEAIVRQQPGDFRAWHNLAAIAYSQGDLDTAARLERKAVGLSPDYAEAWNTLGAIALVRRETDAAVDALTKATRFGPRNAQAFDNLSLALRAAGQSDGAHAAAKRACDLDKRFCGTRN
jgi:choline-sulfatase